MAHKSKFVVSQLSTGIWGAALLWRAQAPVGKVLAHRGWGGQDQIKKEMGEPWEMKALVCQSKPGAGSHLSLLLVPQWDTANTSKGYEQKGGVQCLE